MGISARTNRVLLVGGDVGTQATLSVILSSRLQLEAVSLASDAIRFFTRLRPGLVLLDIRTADPDCVTLLRVIRASRDHCSVVVLAGAQSADVVSELAGQRIDGLYRGRVRFGELLEQIAYLLGGCQNITRGVLVSDRTSRALEEISRYYRRIRSVASVAGPIGVSSSRLAHQFRAEIGTPLMRFVTCVRIEVARRYLREGDKKLETIAELVGFCDGPHLSRLFRRYTGRLPGSYRRNAREAKSA